MVTLLFEKVDDNLTIFDHIISFVLNYLVNQILVSIVIDKWSECTNKPTFSLSLQQLQLSYFCYHKKEQ